MFRFNFDIDDADDNGFDPVVGPDTAPAQTEQGQLENAAVEHSSREVSLDDLLSSLPHTISFSPLNISLPSGHDVVLSRRDLFDARFQLISADDGLGAVTDTGPSEVEFIDAPSDLVPGVYEGGLKTWECSLDLVACLSCIYGPQIANALDKQRILELGCGTAIPSLYLIHSIFSAQPNANAGVHVHLQDYNEMVLRLVTVPNVILAWYMSPASGTYRTSVPTGRSEVDNDDDDAMPLPPADPSQLGELALTPGLKTAFLASLKTYGIHLKIFSGSWATFDVEQAGGPYDVLLTSETIYRTASLGSLVDLMRRATAPVTQKGGSTSLEDTASRLSLADSEGLKGLAGAPYLCLVAAKLVYFGVGGGVSEFVQAVETSHAGPDVGGGRSNSRVQTVWETNKGVKRSIMRVVWGL